MVWLLTALRPTDNLLIMHIAIIGNGISGITAARFIRKLSDHKITVISAETDYFFSRTAIMYAYMGHMRKEDLKPFPYQFLIRVQCWSLCFKFWDHSHKAELSLSLWWSNRNQAQQVWASALRIIPWSSFNWHGSHSLLGSWAQKIVQTQVTPRIMSEPFDVAEPLQHSRSGGQP